MRTITEGQAIELLHTLFSLTAPVAFDDVKKKYRSETKRLHPDIGGDAEAFKALGGAFDSLKQLYQMGSHLFEAEPLEDGVEDQPKQPAIPRETVDGIPLSELGLGLGPTTNGVGCIRCEQRGYTITKEHARGLCQSCEGRGARPRYEDCVSCNGTGKFTQRRSGRTVDCYTCIGSGKYTRPYWQQRCESCQGLGRTNGKQVTSIFVMKCGECKGTGEILVWNPVIPKGRLAFSGTPPATQTAPRPPSEPKPKAPGKDKLFKSATVNMSSLLDELRTTGIGGKRN